MKSIRSLAFGSLVALALLGAARTADAHPIVTFPNGNEGLAPGTQLTVQWFYLIDHGPGTLNVYLSTDAGVSWGSPVTSTSWPATSATFTIPNTPGILNKVKVEYLPLSGDQFPDETDGLFCINDPAVTAMNFFIGTQMHFQVQAPGWPNGTAIVFANATGLTGTTLNLPGGVSVDLVPDIWTLILLSIPSMSVVPLDANGMGTSQPAMIPNNPQLSGVWTWAIAVGILPQGIPFGWPFAATSCTVTPTVL